MKRAKSALLELPTGQGMQGTFGKVQISSVIQGMINFAPSGRIHSRKWIKPFPCPHSRQIAQKDWETAIKFLNLCQIYNFCQLTIGPVNATSHRSIQSKHCFNKGAFSCPIGTNHSEHHALVYIEVESKKQGVVRIPQTQRMDVGKNAH